MLQGSDTETSSRAVLRAGFEAELEVEGRRRLSLSRQGRGCCGRVCRGGSAAERILVPCADLVPVDHIPPCLDVVRATVLVLQVVSVLPDIASQDWDAGGAVHSIHEWVVLVRGGRDRQLLVIGDNQPHPAGAETGTRSTSRFELGLEVVEGAKGLVDGLCQLVRRCTALAGGCHLQPEEVVVVSTAAAVAERRTVLDGRLLQLDERRLGLPLQGLVDVRHVGQVMLVMVELHRRLVDGGLQCIVRVGQVREVVGLCRLQADQPSQTRGQTGSQVTPRGRRLRSRGQESQIHALPNQRGGHCQG
mmetsp:Transcript_5342/g.12548  ORF Transcript_5342/g.12548 Transcript_5342/m.12548 type:complete len:304 (-) Transcript_5342:88-999(-)